MASLHVLMLLSAMVLVVLLDYGECVKASEREESRGGRFHKLSRKISEQEAALLEQIKQSEESVKVSFGEKADNIAHRVSGKVETITNAMNNMKQRLDLTPDSVVAKLHPSFRNVSLLLQQLRGDLFEKIHNMGMYTINELRETCTAQSESSQQSPGITHGNFDMEKLAQYVSDAIHEEFSRVGEGFDHQIWDLRQKLMSVMKEVSRTQNRIEHMSQAMDDVKEMVFQLKLRSNDCSDALPPWKDRPNSHPNPPLKEDHPNSHPNPPPKDDHQPSLPADWSGAGPDDCSDILQKTDGNSSDGVYLIAPRGKNMTVYCDMTGGGWTVIQRRWDGKEPFELHNYLIDYVFGFGVLHEDHWLGLKRIVDIEWGRRFDLRIDLWNASRYHAYAQYENFYGFPIDGFSTLYMPWVLKPHSEDPGTLGDGLLHARGEGFRIPTPGCKRESYCVNATGPWWQDCCAMTSLNGNFNDMYWSPWINGEVMKVVRSEIKIRPSKRNHQDSHPPLLPKINQSELEPPVQPKMNQSEPQPPVQPKMKQPEPQHPLQPKMKQPEPQPPVQPKMNQSEPQPPVQPKMNQPPSKTATMPKEISNDCWDILLSNRSSADGVYVIAPLGVRTDVYCDMTGGGWTVIQKRYNGGEHFERESLESYTKGFGNKWQEYWLGLEFLLLFSRRNDYNVRFELWNASDYHAYAQYSSLEIVPESFGIDDWSAVLKPHRRDPGTLGDGLLHARGKPFQMPTPGCKRESYCVNATGPWWQDCCAMTSLNGDFNDMYWSPWENGEVMKVVRSVIKIRPSEGDRVDAGTGPPLKRWKLPEPIPTLPPMMNHPPIKTSSANEPPVLVNDCCEILRKDKNSASGVYSIAPLRQQMEVSCDMGDGNCDMNGTGGWTIIQRRYNGDEHFERKSLGDYIYGFGDPKGDHWIGLQGMSLIMYTGHYHGYDLRIDLWNSSDHHGYSQYTSFDLNTMRFGYSIFDIKSHSDPGTLGDGMLHVKGRVFKLPTAGCKRESYCINATGAWWQDCCAMTSLNGDFNDMYWSPWINGEVMKVVRSEIKIRPSMGDKVFRG